jgi:RimJ/RimL family protein N-acetyltransferase
MTPAPVLRTERLILRRPGPEDVPAMLRFFASDRARFYDGPMDEGAGWRRFAAYVGQWTLRGYGLFAMVERRIGETIGLAGPFHPQEFAEPEMSWLLADAAHEGRGYAREGCAAVLAHLFETHRWPSVVSYIDRGNAPSRALAERLGARLDPDAAVPLPNCEAYRHRPRAGAEP